MNDPALPASIKARLDDMERQIAELQRSQIGTATGTPGVGTDVDGGAADSLFTTIDGGSA